jgi:plasmid stabilization system protein ParE
MSSKPFQFHPAAREEFREAVRWYRARSDIASAEFRMAVTNAVREIAKKPHRWPKYLHGDAAVYSRTLSVVGCLS